MVLEKCLFLQSYSTASVCEDKVWNTSGFESDSKLLPFCYIRLVDVVIIPFLPFVVIRSRLLHIDIMYRGALCDQEF